MARHIVKFGDLKTVVDYWIRELSEECGDPTEEPGIPGKYGTVTIRWFKSYVPPVSETDDEEDKPREPPLLYYQQGIFESLEGPRWERINWFYHCDDAWGNTIRLYDDEHYQIQGNPRLYYEKENTFGHLGKRLDRVIIRTENIGKRTHPLKRRLFKIFGEEWWKSYEAPTPEFGPNSVCDTEKLCEYVLERRLAYFQHPIRNCSPTYMPFGQCDRERCFPWPIPPRENASPREVRKYEKLREIIESRRENWERCSDGDVI